MPVLNDLFKATDWVEPDDVPRPVVTYGYTTDDISPIELDFHRHRKGQIMLVQKGALTCEVESGLWIVPPRSAVWIPGGTLHAVKMTGALECFDAFVDPAVGQGLPKVCCAVAVTPLMRELMTRAAQWPLLYEQSAANARLVEVLLDELAVAKIEQLNLPMPSDIRLRKIVDEMIAVPGVRGKLEIWAKRAGLSERSLERMIVRETGMSFGRWRQQLAVILAVKWLAGGASIQQVAADLGYESVPSFMTMFRKVLGTSPGRYMAERYSQR